MRIGEVVRITAEPNWPNAIPTVPLLHTGVPPPSPSRPPYPIKKNPLIVIRSIYTQAAIPHLIL